MLSESAEPAAPPSEVLLMEARLGAGTADRGSGAPEKETPGIKPGVS